MPSIENAIAILRETRIPCAPVLTVEQAMNHPHLIERETVQNIHDRLLGDFKIPGFPLRFSAFPKRLDLQAPLLGEHNRPILKKYLGMSPAQIEKLERDGVLQSAPH
jgi:CoA:oxalate CoA-transferase